MNEVVYSYMEHVGEGHHEDFMRAFFRLRAQDVGELLAWTMSLLKRLEREAPSLPTLGPALCEANRAILVCIDLISFL